ncbi:hypothetical protein ACJJTC_003074 [Scirpophaga incertulas]
MELPYELLEVASIFLTRSRYNFFRIIRHLAGLEAQQALALHTIARAPRYVRNSVLHRDLKMSTIREHTIKLARNMYERASKSAHPLIKDLAPQHARPLEGRLRMLPSDLLLTEEGSD